MQNPDFFKKILIFFDKLEDRVRGRLSRMPVVYALIGGTAIVLFWRGIWVIADNVSYWLTGGHTSISGGIISVAVSVVIMLLTGLFVSFFIGDIIIMSGLKGEKKLVEKEEKEIEKEFTAETTTLETIKEELDEIKEELKEIKK
jgi:hypothetical protein